MRCDNKIHVLGEEEEHPGERVTVLPTHKPVTEGEFLWLDMALALWIVHSSMAWPPSADQHPITILCHSSKPFLLPHFVPIALVPHLLSSATNEMNPNLFR